VPIIMKKLLLLLVSLLCLSPVIAGMPPGKPGGGMLPMPTAQEMEEIQKFLDTLSPEELDELAKIGEEMIETAEKEGRPLFGPAPVAPTTPKPKPTSTKHTVKPKEQAKPKARVLTSKEKSRIQRILSGLVDTIASIRQKATSDETLVQLIAPLNKTLSDLTYYLNVVNYSKHLVHLTDTEFTPLNNNLRKLYEQVEEIDSELTVPEIEVGKKQTTADLKLQRQQIKDATSLLQKFISIIESATAQKHILTDLERLVQKYEPEALKIKKDQEEKEKKASAHKTSLPTTNTVQTYQSPSGKKATQQYTGGPGNRGGSYGGGGTGLAGSSARPGSSMSLPASSPSSSTPGTPGTAGTANAKKTTDKKKKEEEKATSPIKETEADKTYALEQKIKTRIDHVDQITGYNKSKLDSFMDTYLVSTDDVNPGTSKDISDIFNEASFELSKVKKDVASWVLKIKSQASSGTECRNTIDRIKQQVNDKLRSTQDLHTKIKNASGLLNSTTPTARVTEHKIQVDNFAKHIDDIIKELNKPL
jgi:hypothetical protein